MNPTQETPTELHIELDGHSSASVDLVLTQSMPDQENWNLRANVPVELSRTTLVYKAINAGLDWLRQNRPEAAWRVNINTRYFSLS